MTPKNPSSESGKSGGGSSRAASPNSSNYIKLQQSEAVRSNIYNISQLLNTGLSQESLDICIRLCEAGVHPQSLANIVNQIRREMAVISDEK